MFRPFNVLLLCLLCAMICQASVRAADWTPVENFDIQPLPNQLDFFPAATQFTPVPSGKGWKGEEGPLSDQVLADTIDNYIEHGFTGLNYPRGRTEKETDFILNYAQSRGMFIVEHLPAVSGFRWKNAPDISPFSPAFQEHLNKKIPQLLEKKKNLPRLYNVFTFQDEPFHWGHESLDFSQATREEFKKRYGYDMPESLAATRDDPEKRIDFLNFQSLVYTEAWKQIYGTYKRHNPGFKLTLTHDSHNSLGSGAGSHASMAIDDVFFWGGDFADIYVYDLYPFTQKLDYRLGLPSKLYKPLMSQTHFTFAQMRNLAYTFDKELGFWFGTYNMRWFKDFLDETQRRRYWTERLMSTTAVAEGADFIQTGYGVPEDARRWEELGQGLRLIQKTGGDLLEMPRVQPRAAMLFPRTHYLLTQREYYNVAMAFECFMDAFGPLDIIHEEQLAGDLNDYDTLLLFDVEYLPEDAAGHIRDFARKGGVVLADCLPQWNEKALPLETMKEVFGVSSAGTGGIHHKGHLLHLVKKDPLWYYPTESEPEEMFSAEAPEVSMATDVLAGSFQDRFFEIELVSPRPAQVSEGHSLMTLEVSGQSGLVSNRFGKGRTFLLGFSLQDTYFQTFADDQPGQRVQLMDLLAALMDSAGRTPRVASSNPRIAASVRGNKKNGGYLFLINEESEAPDTRVTLQNMPFRIGEITNLDTGKKMDWEKTGKGKIQLTAHVPFGKTMILRLKR